MTSKTAKTFYATIHIAGNINTIEKTCNNFCRDNGLCVTVTPTKYIYTGGEQSGATVRLINYPRFPKEPEEIVLTAKQLAEEIRFSANQESYTIETPDTTIFYSSRENNDQ